MAKNVNIFWFRRDLRLQDNAGLYHALKEGSEVVPIFIFDTKILSALDEKRDARITFIHAALSEIQIQLIRLGSSLEVYHGSPPEVFAYLFSKYRVGKLFANHDYEPYALERDAEIAKTCIHAGVIMHTFKDQVIFEKNEVIKDSGEPYTVFTPYSRRWNALLNYKLLAPYHSEKHFGCFFQQQPHPVPTIRSLGFLPVDLDFPPKEPDKEIIVRYEKQRDFPSLNGTSRMGVHLRFGTASIRQLARSALESSPVFLKELIWREFYQSVLWHFPGVGKGQSFKPKYDWINWRNNEEEFERWCRGTTGYPIVDAGMRQLSKTGFMHNRVRMIVSSFLSKHLLIDWRWGEAWFAKKLLDFDLAANNGGWQWASGSGCDAAPYFRIFNPSLQASKFDPQSEYIRRWVPEFELPGYPKPIVEHAFARKRALDVYNNALRRD